MGLKSNVVANYVGQGWRALMGLVFIPLYIKYLGVEAYGLIGILAILQAWLSLLDMGMRPALSRELARFTGGAHSVRWIRDLLRSVEMLVMAIAAAAALAIWAASRWLASEWVTPQDLPRDTVARAFALMGLVAALRFIESVYASVLVGLQRQVTENVLSSVLATMRALGALCVLAWITPTVDAFFTWQAVISLISIVLFAVAVYRTLPGSPQSAQFSGSALRGVWRFAAGMMVITLLALLLTQVDKILLSRLLTLEAFGYYALAGVLANALYLLVGPVTTAFYPRFTEYVTQGDDAALRSAYHQSAQLVTVLMGAAAVILMIFGDRVLLLWTSDAALTRQVAPLLSILTLGTLLNGLMWVPYQMQLAHGWTTLVIKVNVIAVSLFIPAIVLVVPAYGAVGAAWVWVALNSGYLIFVVSFMHRRLLRAEKWRWYRQDVGIPLAGATATAILLRWVLPADQGRVGGLLLSSACVLIAAALTAPLVRKQLACNVLRASRDLRHLA